MANDKTQVWKFTDSQALLITEQARQHAAELVPFKNYQSRAQNDLLVQFRDELGIHEDTPLTVDLNNLQFLLRDQPTPAPDEPVEVDGDPVDGEEPAAE
jgi:hypothetical protein